MRNTLIALASTLSLGSAHVLAADLPNSGDSSVFLSIWHDGGSNPTIGTSGVSDFGNNRTLIVDTGLKFSDLIYNEKETPLGPYTIDIDALVTGATSYSSAADIFDEPFDGSLYMQVVAFDGILTGGDIAGDYAAITTYEGSIAGSNVELSNSIVKSDTFFGFVSDSTATVSTTQNGTVTYDDSWGDNFGGSWSAIDNAITFDTNNSDSAGELTLNMAFVRTGGGGGNGENLDITRPLLFSSAFDFSTGDLVITTAAVPVPAAVWLFGSAIAGLIGFSRRSPKTFES